jgi:DNA topoisomerase-1
VRLPPLAVDDALSATELSPKGHTTQPPARFTEASLVKALEELGVGRPSTYASILATIQDRGYVSKRGSALVPSFTAFAVVGLLEEHFGNLVDYSFTASMEDELDDIAGGREEASPWLRRFYFGNGHVGLKTMVSERLGDIDAREVNSIPIGTDGEGREIVVRVGRYGPYVQRGDERASVPEDLAPDELTPEKADELLSAPSGDRVLGDDPDTGLPVLARAGRYGPYVQLGELDGDSKEKPRTASLLKTMALDTISLEEALRLLTLPRIVGVDPADGEEIAAQNGRYGPYLKKGSDSRSLADEEQMFTVTVEEALALFAQPKRGRGRAAAAPPLREVGPDPTTGAPIVAKDGRYGPYLTDGEVNVSVPKGDTVEGITVERAAELLAEKRAMGPRPKSKKATKKVAKKVAKKAAKKTAKKASKTSAKKAAGGPAEAATKSA